jgi:hypothetical protein
VLELSPFLQHLEAAFNNGELQRLVLSRYEGDDKELQRVILRPVALKGQTQLTALFEKKTFDITKNFDIAEVIEMLNVKLGVEFKSALLQSSGEEWQLSFSKKNKLLQNRTKLKTAAPMAVATAHNREKQRFVEQSRAYLQALGITDANGQVVPSMSKKWKQINKFVEILAKAIRETGLQERQEVHVADFGSGKAYLTFAVHDFLQQLGMHAQVTGVELRPALVDLCNETATKLALNGLRFEQGDVQHFQARGVNVMIALHACDTATDYAIHMGIRTGAEIIMCSPCCHKQIRPQLQSPAVLSPLLQHGIHLGQEAEMLTDGIRALLLEAEGYDTQVFEFISLEHTSKNKMILAQKRRKVKDNSAVLKQVEALKAFYGITDHCLEQLLAASALEKETSPAPK